MPWKESCPMEERVKFIGELLQGESMTDLCKEYGISRKTGYKFKKRFAAYGVEGLRDESNKAHYHPNQTPQEIEKLIVDLRTKKTSWGPKKLKSRLEKLYPGLNIPAHSTIGDILNRYDLPKRKMRRRKHYAQPTSLHESEKPNDIWCVDFKGQFKLGNQRYCYPLTVSDHFSRYLLGCEGLENTKTGPTMAVFEEVFQAYGLPISIRSDNGAPFASCGLAGWSRLSVWWMRLGINLERIEPGKPQQNGRHERMHLTLKQDATRPAKNNFLQQQECFDQFQHDYNKIRPHEALQMKTPHEVYVKSNRPYPGKLKPLEYPLHDTSSKVQHTGVVKIYGGHRFYLSSSLEHERVGFREIKPGLWLVSFIDHDLGYYNESTKIFYETLDQNRLES
jgi:transposase InsO family protein/transposase-like protein